MTLSRARPRLRSALLLGVVSLVLLCGAAAKDWRRLITDHDRTRLHNWRTEWTDAITRARGGKAGPSIDAEGILLQPDAAIDGSPPPDGLYACRVVKVGAQTPLQLQFVTYPGAHCRIANGRFTKLDGSQRPHGRLYPYESGRLLFLGAMALGDERGSLPYGRDPDRDMVGIVERIGPHRWRLVLPSPKWESMLDVIDLVPAAS